MNREEHKDAIEVSVIFHEGQRMFAVPKQPALAEQPAPVQQEPVDFETERKDFETWYDRIFVRKGHAEHHRYRDGYCIDAIQNQWAGWKERAKRAASQPARPYRLLQDNGSKYFGESWDKAEQPAQQAPMFTYDQVKAHIQAAMMSAAPVQDVTWGVDWGKAGDASCVCIIKRLPDGRIEVVAVEYGPQRTWVGLTESEKSAALYDKDGMTLDYEDYAEAIEAKLRSKNEDRN
jgi:hypothetical protein